MLHNFLNIALGSSSPIVRLSYETYTGREGEKIEYCTNLLKDSMVTIIANGNK